MDNENGRYVMTPTSTGGQLIYKRTHFTWHRHIPGTKSDLPLICDAIPFVRVAAQYIRARYAAHRHFRWNFAFASIGSSERYRYTRRMHFAIVRRAAARRDVRPASRANFRLLRHSSRFNNRNGNRCRDHVVKNAYLSMKFAARAPRE